MSRRERGPEKAERIAGFGGPEGAGLSGARPKPRIIWYAAARSPYNDFLFSELAKQADLTVYVRIERPASHPWELGTPGYDCRALRGRLLTSILECWRADLVVVVGWDYVAHLLVAMLLSPFVRNVFWTDTPNVRRRNFLHRALRALIVRFVFWRFDEVWATGAPGCRSVEQLGCPFSKVASFPFFVGLDVPLRGKDDFQVEAFRAQHGGADRTVLLCVGRLIPSKKYDDAIRAMQHVDGSAVLWIAGDGPERAGLADLIEELGLGGRVHLLGWLQPAQTAVAVDASDVFVHPAETDPFPTVVLDAMSRGKPVIGTSTSGSVADRVRDAWNGYVVPPAEPQLLAQRINHLVRDGEAMRSFGLRALETARKFPVTIGIEMIFRAIGRESRLEG